jgi:hypothetical protein
LWFVISRFSGLSLVVTGAGAVLVASAPGGPVQPLVQSPKWTEQQGGEEVTDLVADEGDLVGRRMPSTGACWPISVTSDPGSRRPEVAGFEGQRIDVRQKDTSSPDGGDATDRQDRAVGLGRAVV